MHIRKIIVKNYRLLKDFEIDLEKELSFIGCAVCFIASSAAVDTYIGKALSYVGRYSLQFYVLNGFALVPARIIAVKMLHLEEAWIIVTMVFLLNLIFEIIMLETLKRIPYVRWCFGIK